MSQKTVSGTPTCINIEARRRQAQVLIPLSTWRGLSLGEPVASELNEDEEAIKKAARGLFGGRSSSRRER